MAPVDRVRRAAGNCVVRRNIKLPLTMWSRRVVKWLSPLNCLFPLLRNCLVILSLKVVLLLCQTAANLWTVSTLLSARSLFSAGVLWVYGHRFSGPMVTKRFVPHFCGNRLGKGAFFYCSSGGVKQIVPLGALPTIVYRIV